MAVTIPKPILREWDFRDGSKVDISSTSIGVVIRKPTKHSSKPRPDFFALLEKVNDHYGEALKEIAKK